MPAGRPTEYKPEFIQMTKDYLQECRDSEKVIGEGNMTRIVPVVNIPTIEGLAVKLGCNKTTLYEWEKDHPEFSNALNQVRTEQHNRLVNNGLAGTYNSTIAKLILSSNHGYKEKTENDQNHKGELTVNVTKYNL